MSVRTLTAVTNNVGDDPILHIAALKEGGWKAACGTRVNNIELLQQQWPTWINCGKCRARLRREGFNV